MVVPEAVAGDVELTILGPLSARRNGELVPLGPVRQRAVIGLLAVSPGMRATRESLIEALWGEPPPPTAVTMIHSYISRLRRALGPERGGHALATTPNGYRLEAAHLSLDLAEFIRLTRQARESRHHGDPARACRCYERALVLWHGEPLADVEPLRLHPRVISVARLRSTAIAEFGETAVAHGWPDRALPSLQNLLDTEPLNERACAWLMLALAGCGQQAAALAAYESIRRLLDIELGVLPGEELSQAHQRVLRQQLPAPGDGVPRPRASRRDRPRQAAAALGCQLPPAVTDFTGRQAEAKALAGMVPGGTTGGGVPVAVVIGLPGVGKTSLAVRVAHAIRESFADGQLWISLDGASRHPREPADVLGELLRTLGVHGSELPASVAARAALYRSRLAGRRILVVADDAGSAAQVEPLLPGTPGSAVIITSRSALAAPPGAQLLPLGPLTSREATELLGRIAGRQRITAEQDATAELVSLCGMLPLAVRIAGSRLSARPTWPVSVLVGKLSSQLRRLDELQAGGMSVRASLASSYEALDERAQQAFCLLGMLGLVEVAEWVVAALLDDVDASDVVAELADGSLLLPVGVDATGQPRYRLHDLLRDFAAERLAAEWRPGQGDATSRVLHGWLQLATLAASHLPLEPYFPRQQEASLPGPLPADVASALTADAVSWLTAERLNLIAAAEQACRTSDYLLAERLARVLAGFHYLHSRPDDAQRMWDAVRRAAEQAGDRPVAVRARLRLAALSCVRGGHAEAMPAIAECVDELGRQQDRAMLMTALYWLSACAMNLGRFTEACQHASRAAAIAISLGDRHGELMSLRIQGIAQASIPGLEREGVANCRRAYALVRKTKDPVCQREIMHTLAHVYNRVHQHQTALALCLRGLALERSIPYPAGRGPWLGVLGDAYHGLGRHRDAAEALSRALSIFAGNYMRRHEALCLLKLGYAHKAMAEYRQALSYFEVCLPLFQELGLPHYERLTRQALSRCESDLAPAGDGSPARD
jgi:DNA-binding SARP family transcriptional activator/tetratricopeptide (TPR) repeat protein